MRIFVAILAGLLMLGCSTGEGPKQYNLGDNYFLVCPVLTTNAIPRQLEIYLEMYNQTAASSTGRDRVTKPSAELTVPAVAAP